MKIERNNDEIIIRISSKVRPDGIQQLVDFLEQREATAKSEANQEDIDALVNEIKKGWWSKNKDRLLSGKSLLIPTLFSAHY